ncbi:hypothetical protein [Amycolatopsis sp. NPDC051061]|uniref:hypothetical protein n=1 Tax=Amycolatopsis sp. NPDC051061 TaxID=3155042 RepID=UPI0034465162
MPTLEELVEAGRAGRMVDLTDGDPEHRESVDASMLAEVLASGPRAVRLKGARITGELDLSALTIECPLWLDSCFFEQAVLLAETQAKSISLRDSHVPALVAQDLRTSGSLHLNGLTADNIVLLMNAHIGGHLEVAGAELGGSGPGALIANGVVVDGHLIGSDLTVRGVVLLSDANVGRDVSLEDANLGALRAGSMTVAGSVSCRGCTATGPMWLAGTKIGNHLDLAGARLSNADGIALEASEVTVGRDLRADSGFTADGEIHLVNADIGGRVLFTDATVKAALMADGCAVGDDLELGPELTAAGSISLHGARVDGHVRFNGTSSVVAGETALNLARLRADSLLLFPREPFQGKVDLSRAQVREFYDLPESWSPEMAAFGFTYQVLRNDFLPVRERLSWLRRATVEYDPGAYDQLSAAYRRGGQVEAARRVGLAKQRHRRDMLNPLGRLWNRLLSVTVGYGYRTWLAGLWLVLLVALGTLLFGGAYRTNMRPTAPAGPAFQPVAYSLDVLVPIVDLGQKKAWFARGPAQAWSWVFTGAGWVLTTAVVAGVTNALKRD